MKRLTIEHEIELGDKIHNADEIILLTHKLDVNKTKPHDIHIVVVGEQDRLVDLLAKQFCEHHAFFNLICLAIDKLDYRVTEK